MGASCGTQLCDSTKAREDGNPHRLVVTNMTDDVSGMDDKVGANLPTKTKKQRVEEESEDNSATQPKEEFMSPLQKRLAKRKEDGGMNYLSVDEVSPRDVRESGGSGNGQGYVLGGEGETADESIGFLQSAENTVKVSPS